jgi:hypothetical protein
MSIPELLTVYIKACFKDMILISQLFESALISVEATEDSSEVLTCYFHIGCLSEKLKNLKKETIN